MADSTLFSVPLACLFSITNDSTFSLINWQRPHGLLWKEFSPQVNRSFSPLLTTYSETVAVIQDSHHSWCLDCGFSIHDKLIFSTLSFSYYLSYLCFSQFLIISIPFSLLCSKESKLCLSCFSSYGEYSIPGSIEANLFFISPVQSHPSCSVEARATRK